MVWDRDEIERMKAAVPVEFRPVGETHGLLAEDFQAGLQGKTPTLHDSGNISIDAELDTHNIGLQFVAQNVGEDGGPASPGFLLAGAQAAKLAQRIAMGEEKKNREATDAVLRDQLMDALNRRLAELEAELAKIDERLGEIEEERAALGERLEALDEIARLHKRGELDPANPAHAQLLAQAGLSAEDAQREDFDEIIAQQRHEMSEQDSALEGEWQDLMNQKHDVEQECGKIRHAQEGLSYADTPEAMQEAVRQAATALGEEPLTGVSDMDWDTEPPTQPEQAEKPTPPPAVTPMQP
jgi:predicted  nucleic acid-binding Zn-ribbon protein